MNANNNVGHEDYVSEDPTRSLQDISADDHFVSGRVGYDISDINMEFLRSDSANLDAQVLDDDIVPKVDIGTDPLHSTGEARSGRFQQATSTISSLTQEHQRDHAQDRKLLWRWQKLNLARQDLLGLRVRLEETRRILQARQERPDFTTPIFKDSIVKLLAEVPHPSADDILQHLGSVRLPGFTALQEEEAVRDRLEEDIIQLEFKIQQLESKIYGTNPDSIIQYLRIIHGSTSIASMDDTISTITDFEEQVDDSPEKQQYLSQLGEVDMLRERVLDLRAERAQLVFEQESRARFGLALDQSSLNFLEAFDREHGEALREFDLAEAELSRLNEIQQESARAGQDALVVMQERTNIQYKEASPLALELTASSPEDIPLPGGLPLHEALLFRDSDGTLLSECFPRPESESMTTPEFVNAWLLNQIRSDRPLAVLFSSQPFLHDPNIDSDNILSLLLENWFADGTEISFMRSRDVANHDYPQSRSTRQGNTRAMNAKSDSFLHPRRLLVPLLSTNADTRVNDILQRAQDRERARGTRSLGHD